MMVQERAVEAIQTENPANAGHTTIIVEKRRSGGRTVFLALFLVLAALFAAYLFSEMKAAETAKDDAVTQAAASVGKAADRIGAAAEQAGNAAQDAVDKIDKR